MWILWPAYLALDLSPREIVSEFVLVNLQINPIYCRLGIYPVSILRILSKSRCCEWWPNSDLVHSVSSPQIGKTWLGEDIIISNLNLVHRNFLFSFKSTSSFCTWIRKIVDESHCITLSRNHKLDLHSPLSRVSWNNNVINWWLIPRM